MQRGSELSSEAALPGVSHHQGSPRTPRVRYEELVSLELPATSLPVISEHPEYSLSLALASPGVSGGFGAFGSFGSDLRLDEMQQQQMKELQRLQFQWQLLGFDRMHFVKRPRKCRSLRHEQEQLQQKLQETLRLPEDMLATL